MRTPLPIWKTMNCIHFHSCFNDYFCHQKRNVFRWTMKRIWLKWKKPPVRLHSDFVHGTIKHVPNLDGIKRRIRRNSHLVQNHPSNSIWNSAAIFSVKMRKLFSSSMFEEELSFSNVLKLTWNLFCLLKVFQIHHLNVMSIIRTTCMAVLIQLCRMCTLHMDHWTHGIEWAF